MAHCGPIVVEILPGPVSSSSYEVTRGFLSVPSTSSTDLLPPCLLLLHDCFGYIGEGGVDGHECEAGAMPLQDGLPVGGESKAQEDVEEAAGMGNGCRCVVHLQAGRA